MAAQGGPARPGRRVAGSRRNRPATETDVTETDVTETDVTETEVVEAVEAKVALQKKPVSNKTVSTKTVSDKKAAPTPPRSATARAKIASAHLPTTKHILALIAAVLVLAALVVTNVLLVSRASAGPKDNLDQILSTTKTNTALLFSYDYRHVDADKNAAASHLTGEQKTQYIKAMNELVVPNAATQQAVVVFTVDSAAITEISSDGKQAQLLVYGHTTTSNKASTTAETDSVQLDMTVKLVKGSWLIAQSKQL
jgi:Mce-associated membrane protein